VTRVKQITNSKEQRANNKFLEVSHRRKDNFVPIESGAMKKL
jgi:hypothetical protein